MCTHQYNLCWYNIMYYARIRIRRSVCVCETRNANGLRKTQEHAVYYNIILSCKLDFRIYRTPPQYYTYTHYYQYVYRWLKTKRLP